MPNPPPLFVGRQTELSAIRAGLKRAQLFVIGGLGGAGKSALAARLVRTMDPGRRARARRFVVAPDTRLDRLLADLAAELCESPPDWSLFRSREAMLSLVLHAADANASLVLLEDAHHLTDEDARWLIEALLAHADRATWLVTTRRVPSSPGLVGQHLLLAGLSLTETRALLEGAGVACDPADAVRAREATGGSPWRLLQRIAGDPRELETAHGDEPAGLGEETAFLRVLIRLPRPVPLSVIGRVVPLPPSSVMRELERRGILESTPRGTVRMHDVARPLFVKHAARAAEHDGPLVRALRSSTELAMWLEALELAAASSDRSLLRETLAEIGTELLARGAAPQLVAALERANDPQLAVWRLRAAVELGDTGVALPPLLAVEDPNVLLACSRLLLARGTPAESLALLERFQGCENTTLFVRVRLHHAVVLDHLARNDDAIALLSAIAIDDPVLRAKVGTRIAWEQLQCGRDERAREMLPDLLASAAQLIEARQWHPLAMLAIVAWHLGEHDRARTLLGAVDRGAIAVGWRTREGRYVATVRIAVFAESGAFARALDDAKAMGRFSDAPIARLEHLALRAFARAGLGDFDGLWEELIAVVAQVSSAPGEQRYLRRELGAQLVRVAVATGSETLPIAEGEGETDAKIAEWRLRRGEGDGRIESRRHSQLPCDALVLATSALLDGETDAALSYVARATRADTRFVPALAHLEAMQLRCDTLLAARRLDALGTAAKALARDAAQHGSHRFALEARFYAAASSPAGLDAELLHELAAKQHVAPCAARRAQLLLGRDARPDLVDARVLAALEASAVPNADASDAPAGKERSAVTSWAIDSARRVVLLPGRRRVELRDTPVLWKLLCSLVAAGERAHIEQLVAEVWGARYHPLRHDNRVRVTVRKLRELIEDDPSAPRRLLTIEGGYKLEGALLAS